MDQLLDALRRIAEDPSRNATALAAAVAIVVIFVILIVLILIAIALPGRSQTAPSRATTAPGPLRLWLRRWAPILITGPLATTAIITGVALWYHGTSTNEYCTRTCHAMAEPAETWLTSSHEEVACVRCHEGRPWRSMLRGLAMRSHSLYLEVTGTPARGDRIPPEICMECHLNVIEKPLTARNGEEFLHGEVLTQDPTCTRCHGAQGHVPPSF